MLERRKGERAKGRELKITAHCQGDTAEGSGVWLLHRKKKGGGDEAEIMVRKVICVRKEDGGAVRRQYILTLSC